MINRETQEQSFFHDGVANLQLKSNKIWPKRKKIHLQSRFFQGLENCRANLKTFSRIQDAVGTLGFPYMIGSITEELARKLKIFRNVQQQAEWLFRDETLLTSETLSENKVYLTSNKKGTSECANSRKHGLLN